MKILRSFLLSVACVAFACSFAPARAAETGAAVHRFEIGADHFLLDGQPLQIRCGELHAPRVPREYWSHRLRMIKAMGLNTVCAYLFWNMHEPRPGEYDWAGQADIVEFCRLAQAEGLWVILRPGPYACAEWEMGGLPWWLLKHDGIQLRSRDPRYLDAAKRYLQEVGRVLGPLQVTQGLFFHIQLVFAFLFQVVAQHDLLGFKILVHFVQLNLHAVDLFLPGGGNVVQLLLGRFVFRHFVQNVLRIDDGVFLRL